MHPLNFPLPSATWDRFAGRAADKPDGPPSIFLPKRPVPTPAGPHPAHKKAPGIWRSGPRGAKDSFSTNFRERLDCASQLGGCRTTWPTQSVEGGRIRKENSAVKTDSAKEFFLLPGQLLALFLIAGPAAGTGQDKHGMAPHRISCDTSQARKIGRISWPTSGPSSTTRAGPLLHLVSVSPTAITTYGDPGAAGRLYLDSPACQTALHASMQPTAAEGVLGTSGIFLSIRSNVFSARCR